MKIKSKFMFLVLAASSAVLFSGCSLAWVGQFIGDALGDALWLGGID